MGRCPGLRCGHLLVLLLSVAAVLPASGCAQALFTIAYLFKGNDEDAEYDGLKDKKVAVVCRQASTVHYANGRIDQELADQVGVLLKKNVSKIKLIDPQKVNDWMDEDSSGLDDLAQVGKAVQADMVVALDLDRFSLLEGQTLYQGRAVISLKVYDCKKHEVAFKKGPLNCVYPPNSPICTAERSETGFRREFIEVTANQLGRYFYSHDSHPEIGLDAQALR